MCGTRGTVASPFNAFLDAVGGSATKRGKYHDCKCPAHDDGKPSLRVWEMPDGSVGFKCMSNGCDKSKILAAIGWTWKDAIVQTKKTFRTQRKVHGETRKVIAKYAYTDELGNLVYEKWRWQPKTFTQHRWMPNGWELGSLSAGWYVPAEKGRKYWLTDGDQDHPPAAAGVIWVEAAKRYLFLLPEVVAAVGAGDEVWWCEGEKDALNVRGQGRTATSSDSGDVENFPALLTYLEGASMVTIVCDRDEAGYKKGAQKMAGLKDRGIKCRAVEPAYGKDASDHLDRGLSLDVMTEIDPEKRGEQCEAYVAAVLLSRGGDQLSKEQRKVWREQALMQFRAGEPLDLPKRDDHPEEPGLDCWFQPSSDLENVELFLYRWGKDLRWCESLGVWLEWSGGYWRESEKGGAPVRQRWAPMAKRIDAEGRKSEDKRIRSHAQHSVNIGGFSALENMAKNMRETAVSTTELDSDIWAIPCANGMINLKTGQLETNRREALFTRYCPVAYDESVEPDTWYNFLDQATGGDADLMDYLRMMCGYMLTGSNVEQRFYFLHGPGGTGKSTFVAILRAMMGGWARTLDRRELMVGRRRDSTEGLAVLRGSRMVMVPEVMGNDALDESLIKTITGGDTMAVRRMYGRMFEMVPTFKLLMWGNERPRIGDQGQSTWRRLAAIPFLNVVPIENHDPTLERRLMAELPGILAWAVSGAADVHRLHEENRKMPLPRCMEIAADEYRAEADVFGQFLAWAVEPQEHGVETTEDLYKAYVCWCKDQSLKASSKIAFGKRLALRAGFVKNPSNKLGRSWKGISLTSEAYAAVTMPGNTGHVEPADE